MTVCLVPFIRWHKRNSICQHQCDTCVFFPVHIQYCFMICFQNKYVMAVGATLFLGSLGYIVYMNVTDTKPKQTYVTMDEDGSLSSRPRVSRWEWIHDGCPVRQCLNVKAVCHQQCQLQEWLNDGHPVKQCLNVIAVTSSANSLFFFFFTIVNGVETSACTEEYSTM